jgi:hypothetical protein
MKKGGKLVGGAIWSVVVCIQIGPRDGGISKVQWLRNLQWKSEWTKKKVH